MPDRLEEANEITEQSQSSKIPIWVQILTPFLYPLAKVFAGAVVDAIIGYLHGDAIEEIPNAQDRIRAKRFRDAIKRLRTPESYSGPDHPA